MQTYLYSIWWINGSQDFSLEIGLWKFLRNEDACHSKTRGTFQQQEFVRILVQRRMQEDISLMTVSVQQVLLQATSWQFEGTCCSNQTNGQPPLIVLFNSSIQLLDLWRFWMCPVTQDAYRALQMDKKQQENIQKQVQNNFLPLGNIPQHKNKQ